MHHDIEGGLVEHRFKAEEIVEQADRMRALTDEEEIERRHKMGYVVNDYLNMPEKERYDAMMDMFDNLENLNEKDRKVLVKTRTDIMTSLPRKERDKLMQTTKTIYSEYDEDRMAMETKAIQNATAEYGPLKRTMVRRMYKNMMP
jgi:hypothetical protein